MANSFSHVTHNDLLHDDNVLVLRSKLSDQLIIKSLVFVCIPFPENATMAGSSGMPDVLRHAQIDGPRSARIPHEQTVFGWRKYLVIPVVFLYFSSYYMGTTMTEKYIEFRITEDILEEMGIKNYVDLSALSFCNVTNTELLLMMVELEIRLGPWRENLAIASVLPAFVSSLIIGPLVDRIGRRWTLALPICGTLFRAVGYAIVTKTKAALHFLYIAHAIEGALGYFPMVLLASFTIASDITDKDKSRTLLFTVIDAVAAIAQALYLAQIVLIQHWSFTLPNIITMLFALASLILAVFIPSTRAITLLVPSVGESFKRVGSFFACCPNRNRWDLMWFYTCLLIFATASLTFYGRQTTEPVFSAVQPLCWDMAHSGNFVVFRTIGQCLGVIVFVKLLQTFLPDANIAILAALLQMAGFIVEGFGTSSWIMCIGKSRSHKDYV